MTWANPTVCELGSYYLRCPDFNSGDFDKFNGTQVAEYFNSNGVNSDILRNKNIVTMNTSGISGHWKWERDAFASGIGGTATPQDYIIIGGTTASHWSIAPGWEYINYSGTPPKGRLSIGRFSSGLVQSNIANSPAYEDLATTENKTFTVDFAVNYHVSGSSTPVVLNVSIVVTGQSLTGPLRTLAYNGNISISTSSKFTWRVYDPSKGASRMTEWYTYAPTGFSNACSNTILSIFSYDVDGYTVTFTDESDAVNGIDSYLWDFGDGTTSTEQNPVKTYPKSGVYTASLTVTGDDGTDTKEGYITIGSYNSQMSYALSSTILSTSNIAPYIESINYSFGDNIFNKKTGFSSVKIIQNDYTSDDKKGTVNITLVGDLPRWVMQYLTQLSKNVMGSGVSLQFTDDFATNTIYYGKWVNAGDFVENDELLCGGNIQLDCYQTGSV